MSTIRSHTVYLTSQLGRWLKWLAEMENASDPEAQKVTADILAEKILREYVMQKYPDIAKVENKYWTDRSKLDFEAISELGKRTTSNNLHDNTMHNTQTNSTTTHEKT